MASRDTSLTGGPSKWDLVIRGLGDGVPVTFKLGQSEFRFRITSVEAEDGSRESWNVRGYILKGSAVYNMFSNAEEPPRPQSLYFSTRTRTGHANFIRS